MNCRRARIDCNALMDLHDIYEPDARCHPSHAPWMDAGSYRGTPRMTMATFQKAFYFIYFYLYEVTVKSLPHRILLPWEMNNMLYIFKKQASLFGPCRKSYFK